MKEPLDKPQPEIVAETRRTYPLPPSVPLTEAERALLYFMAKQAVREYLDGTLDLEK